GIGNGYFTFASGSAATLTITGKNLAYYTDLVSGANAGKIRVGGAVQSDFNNFQVTGNTLSVIPEPGTLHLLGIAGLGLLIRRRRMQPGYRRRA
ncbi:MAG: PEP-CTERM sorting domain-containing protein, partial [Kiritimatiellaeota bacterium]|nr:PEP-CTERM sorting domain-containing protein [Kiritimatiellota bacterium]